MVFFRKKMKKVTFRHFLEIVFIPSREEYTSFKELLWYNTADYLSFHKDANRFVF